MKIKQSIYFALLIAGFLVLAFGDHFMEKEVSLSIGFVLLMFAIYKISISWRRDKEAEEEQ